MSESVRNRLKFLRMRAPVGQSGGTAVGTVLDYDDEGKNVSVEIGWIQRSEDQLKCVAEEYLEREKAQKSLENGAYFRLSSRDVEALELFMKGNRGAK